MLEMYLIMSALPTFMWANRIVQRRVDLGRFEIGDE